MGALTAARKALCWLWAGQLLTIGLLAAPNAFATLARPDAGAYVARLFQMDARISMVVCVLLLLIEQRRQRQTTPGRLQFTAALLLPALALLCVVGGYEALQPLLVAAKAGARDDFSLLHGLSMAAFVAKTLCALTLAGLSLFSRSAVWVSRA